MNAESTLEDKGKCTACGDTGWAIVPHPAHCSASEWRPVRVNERGMTVYATAGVLCNCHVGRRFLEIQRNDEQGKRAKAMTLEHYSEFVNGNWRAQMRERDAA